MRETIFLTGATGIVGCEIVRTLLRSPECPALVALVRGSEKEVAAKQRWLRRWAAVEPEAAARLEVVRGDVTLPRLGLSESDRARLAPVTTIIHAAAVTRFDQSAETASLNNVASTAHVIELARSLPALERVGMVSTAYVAGRRSGTILEDDLDLAVPFNNEYERSKAIAECAVRQAMADLPMTILRLSIVVGRREDGRVARLSGVYPIFRLFHQGLLSMFPGDADQHLDLIPSDFAAAAICHLTGSGFTAGRTLHVCAGRERSLSLTELFPAIAELLRAADGEWARRGQPLPIAVARDVFEEFAGLVSLTGHPRLRRIVEQTQMVTRMLDTPRVFDTSRFQVSLAKSSTLELDHARRWLAPVVSHGVATGWQQPRRGVA